MRSRAIFSLVFRSSRRGKRHGYGTLLCDDGSVVQSSWVHGRKHGVFTWEKAGEPTKFAEYIDGLLVGVAVDKDACICEGVISMSNYCCCFVFFFQRTCNRAWTDLRTVYYTLTCLKACDPYANLLTRVKVSC